MKTMILDEAESLQSLKNFFEEQGVSAYDYILVQEITDDVDFQNELFECLKNLREFVNKKGFQTVSESFLFKSMKGVWFTINFKEDSHIYICNFDFDHTFNDKKFLENKEILEMYIGTSLFGNEF